MKLFYSNQCGRSMIEMLGVLAIVGILSVGGISAFQQAMTKHKVNKLIGEYVVFLQDPFLKYRDEWRRLQRDNGDNRVYLASSLKSLGLPEGWDIAKDNPNHITDSMGNHLSPFTGWTGFAHPGFGFYLGESKNDTTLMICRQFMSNIIIPFQEEVYHLSISQPDEATGGLWRGSHHCSKNNDKCLANMSLSDITEFCASCVEGKECSIAIYFD